MAFYVIWYENYCLVVPESWMNKKKKTFVWPPKHIKFTTPMMQALKVDESWEHKNYRKLLGPYAQLQEAVEIEKISSTLSTDDSEGLKQQIAHACDTQVTKRLIRRPARFTSEASEGGDDSTSRAVAHGKNRRKLMPEPPSNYVKTTSKEHRTILSIENLEDETERASEISSDSGASNSSLGSHHSFSKASENLSNSPRETRSPESRNYEERRKQISAANLEHRFSSTRKGREVNNNHIDAHEPMSAFDEVFVDLIERTASAGAEDILADSVQLGEFEDFEVSEEGCHDGRWDKTNRTQSRKENISPEEQNDSNLNVSRKQNNVIHRSGAILAAKTDNEEHAHTCCCSTLSRALKNNHRSVMDKLNHMMNWITNGNVMAEPNLQDISHPHAKLPSLPLSTLREMRLFEEEVTQNTQLQSVFQRKIFRIGGMTGPKFLRNIMTCITLDEVLVNCSWTGQKNTIKIADYTMVRIIFETVMQKVPNTTKDELIQTIRAWLRHAGDRVRLKIKRQGLHRLTKKPITTPNEPNVS